MVQLIVVVVLLPLLPFVVPLVDQLPIFLLSIVQLSVAQLLVAVIPTLLVFAVLVVVGRS